MLNFGFLPNIGIPELIVILVLALIIFGPGKLPEVGKAVGNSIREFKKASTQVKEDVANVVAEETAKKEV